MSIQFAATSTSGYQAGVQNLLWPHTCVGQNRLLLVDVGVLSDGESPGIISVTYNGASLSLVKTGLLPFCGRLEIWKMLNPPVGTFNIEVVHNSGNGPGPVDAAVGNAVTYTGVDLEFPIRDERSDSHNNNLGLLPTAVELVTVIYLDWIHAACLTSDGSIEAPGPYGPAGTALPRHNITGSLGSVVTGDIGPIPVRDLTYFYTFGGVSPLSGWVTVGCVLRSSGKPKVEPIPYAVDDPPRIIINDPPRRGPPDSFPPFPIPWSFQR